MEFLSCKPMGRHRMYHSLAIFVANWGKKPSLLFQIHIFVPTSKRCTGRCKLGPKPHKMHKEEGMCDLLTVP